MFDISITFSFLFIHFIKQSSGIASKSLTVDQRNDGNFSFDSGINQPRRNLQPDRSFFSAKLFSYRSIFSPLSRISSAEGLSKKQISSLWTRFFELDRDGRGENKGYKGYLDADDFGRVPKFDENPIAPRLIKVIFDDFGSDGKLTFIQFVNFMSIFSQMEIGGHEHHHHHLSLHGHSHPKQTTAPISSANSKKTAIETVKFSPKDTAKARKIKFMFRVIDRQEKRSKQTR